LESSFGIFDYQVDNHVNNDNIINDNNNDSNNNNNIDISVDQFCSCNYLNKNNRIQINFIYNCYKNNIIYDTIIIY